MHILDTSAVLELVLGTEKGEKLKQHIGGSPMGVTSLTIHELLVGLRETEMELLSHFFHEVAVLPFDKEAAQKSARIEKQLRKEGRMINKMDILIAGICLFHNHELLTCDLDFSRVKELQLKIF